MSNIEIYKFCLVAKSFTRRKTLITKRHFLCNFLERLSCDYDDTVDHFDDCFAQMNVKITFLNENIDETIYTVQPENLV